MASDQCGKQPSLGGQKFITGVPNDDELNPVGVWPWMASIGTGEKNKWNHLCGATLITDRNFLTAAHCSNKT